MEVRRLVSGGYGATLSETGKLKEADQLVIPFTGSKNDWKKEFIQEGGKKRVIELVSQAMYEYLPGNSKKRKTVATKAEIRDSAKFVEIVLKESPTREVFDKTVGAKLYHMSISAEIEKQAQNPEFAWKLPLLETARSPTKNVFNQEKVPVSLTSYLKMLSDASTSEQFSLDFENYEIKK